MCTRRLMDSSKNCSPDSSTMVKDNVSLPARCLEELMMSILEDSTQQGTATSEVVVEVELEAEARPRIQQVPTLLRDIEKTRYCYDPRLVSFGPYHYGKEKLKVGQTLKTKLLQQQLGSLRENRSSGKSIKDFFNQDFGEVAHDARKCYDMDSTDVLKFNDQQFKCLMFLDGCFIVYFIHCIANDKQNDLKMKNDHIAFMIMDLFLLENQLPYIVLQKLLTILLPQESIDVFEKFIKQQTKASGAIPTHEPLYHKLFRWVISHIKSGEKESMVKGTATTSVEVNHEPLIIKKKKNHEPLHLLDLLRNKMLDTSSLPNNRKSQEVGVGDEDNWQSFRSVQELKAAGISCICSGSCCPKHVKFQQNHIYGAELTLPAIVVDDSTKTRWLNLVAYEACPDFSNDLAFTSFVCFMDSLIDHPEDVKELRLKGILYNCLGSDQEVADLFNEITIDLTPDPTAYRKVKLGIQRHYRNGCGIWWAEALQTNFSTPWTTTAFVVAIFIIFLTIFQTYLSVVQTYFQKH